MVLLTSLVVSVVLSILFGLSPTFELALLWRFLLGLGDGMISTVKTTVSELADGDKQLEAESMNFVMSMFGGAFLFAPAIAGALAEPVKQYPNLAYLQEGVMHDLLASYPFLLPNLVAALLSCTCIILVDCFVRETLPERKLRAASSIPEDFVSSIRVLYSKALSTISEAETESDETTPIIATKGTADSGDDHDVIPPEVLLFLQDDVNDAIREAQLFSDEAASAITTPRARLSLVSAASTGQASLALAQRRLSRMSNASAGSIPPATMSSLWSQPKIRNHLVVYWLSSFIMVVVDETFPLFSMSVNAGLSLTEKSIGKILSGFLFLVVQLLAYAPLVARTGLYGSLRLSSVLAPLFTALMPASVWLNRGAGHDHLRWSTMLFLTVVMGSSRFLSLTFFSGLSVAINRLVPPSHRATVNGLSTMGGSASKSIGPAFAGFLVAFFFSSGFFSPSISASALFLVVAGMSAMVATVVILLIRESDDADA
jgi:MFS family permease